MAGHRFSALLSTLRIGTAGAALAAASGDPDEATVISADQLDATLAAAADQGKAEHEATGRTAGMKAQGERYSAVLNTDDGKANLDVALHMLSTTENTAEQINGTLAKMPKKDAAAPTGGERLNADGSTMTAAQRIAAETGKTDVKPNANEAEAEDRPKQVSSAVERYNQRQPGGNINGQVRSVARG